MNGYKIIVIVLLTIIVASIYDLKPAIQHLVYTISDLPGIDPRHVRQPAVFSVAVRAMYLIALVGIIKLLVTRNRKN